MSVSPFTKIEEMVIGGSGPEIKFNEALAIAGAQLRVISSSVTAEPSSPAEGDCYIIPAGATGTIWSGNDGKLALYYGLVWVLLTPVDGWKVFDSSLGVDIRFYNSLWHSQVQLMGGSAVTGLLLTAGAPAVNVTNYATGNGLGATYDLTTGLHTVKEAGFYRIRFNLRISEAASQTGFQLKTEVVAGGVTLGASSIWHAVSMDNDILVNGICTPSSALAVNDTVNLQIRAKTKTITVNINHATFELERIG